MTSIDIYRTGSPPTLQASVQIDEKTLYSKRLMGEHLIKSEFISSSVLPIQILDYITYNAEVYSINRLPEIEKINNSTFKYKIILDADVAELSKKLYISSDGLAQFSLNGTPGDFIDLLITNINSISSGWSKGVVTAKDPVTLEFANEYCRSVLVRIAENFQLEFDIVAKVITMTDAIGSTTTHTFQYGRGLGLYKLTRQQINNQSIITKMFGYGSTKNIPSGYRTRAKRLVFDSGGNRFLTENTDLYGTIEGQFTDDNIYPQRTSTLTASNMVFDAGDSGTDFNPRTSYVEDSALDFNLNDYLIEGIVSKIVFKTGDLAGVECEIWKYDNATKRIYFNPYSDPDGYTMPLYNGGSEVQPEIGDSYTLIDMSLPQSYIDTAEAELLTATQEFLDENCVPQVVYSCDFDPKYAASVSLDLNVGDRVTIIDTDLGINSLIRVSGIEFPLVNPYEIKALIADFVPYTLQERLIKGTRNNRIETVFVDRRNAELARRNTMRQKQMKDLLFDTDGYFETGNIKPLSIETAYLAVGTKSRDFWLNNVTIKANYGGDANALYVSAGSLVHLQIQIVGLGYTWAISPALDQAALTPATAYYLYAKCSKSALTGEWILSATQVTFEQVDGYYHFLAGMLFAVADGYRDFDFTYGMTYINGNTITTGKIQSIDGLTYFDLDTGVISGKITFQSGSSGYAALTDKPTALADINSTEGGKLTGIAAGADRTQTIIDGGLITTGRLGVGNSVSENAGVNGSVSGTPDTDVRFWAGSSFANKAAAPFRVTNAGYVIATKFVHPYILSDSIIISHDADQDNTSGILIKTKTIILCADIQDSITIRITFYIRAIASGNCEGQIYRNGSAVGTLRTSDSGGATFTEDISGWTAGDEIQLYTRVDTAFQYVRSNNFRVLGSFLADLNEVSGSISTP